MPAGQDRSVFEYITDYILTSIETAINDYVIKAVNDVVSGISELCSSDFNEIAQMVKEEVGDDRYVRLCNEVLPALSKLTQQAPRLRTHLPHQAGRTSADHPPTALAPSEGALDSRINLIISELNMLLNVVSSLKQLIHPPITG